MTVPYTTAKSGPYKKNSGVVLGVSAANAPVADLTQITNNGVTKQYGWNPNIPTGVSNSGNLGLQKIFPSRIITQSPYTQSAPNFLVMGLPHSIAGTSSSVLQSCSPDIGIRMPSYQFYAYQRLNITAWNAQTGAATKGAANGSSVLSSGLSGSTGKLADQAYGTNAIPAEYTMLTGSTTPSQLDAPARTNP